MTGPRVDPTLHASGVSNKSRQTARIPQEDASLHASGDSTIEKNSIDLVYHRYLAFYCWSHWIMMAESFRSTLMNPECFCWLREIHDGINQAH